MYSNGEISCCSKPKTTRIIRAYCFQGQIAFQKATLATIVYFASYMYNRYGTAHYSSIQVKDVMFERPFLLVIFMAVTVSVHCRRKYAKIPE